MEREPRNPYQPPAAAVRDIARRRGSPVKAVIFGVLIDVGGSFGAGVVLVLAYSIVLAWSGASAEDIRRAMGAADVFSWFSLLGFCVGAAASFLGGYVCARIVADAEMKWVGIVAAISALVSLAMGAGSLAFDWDALMALISMGAVFAGGWAGRRRNRRSTA